MLLRNLQEGEVGQSPTPPRPRCPFSKRLSTACMRVNYRERTLHTIIYAVITISVQYLQLKARDMTWSWCSNLLRRGGKHFRFLMTDFRPKFLFCCCFMDYWISLHTHIYIYIYAASVACWPLVAKFAGSNPTEAVEFLRAKKSSARLPSEGK